MSFIKDKVLLITGGAGGIGSATAKQALKHGAKSVAIVDLSTENGNKVVESLESEFGTNCAIFIKSDISDKKQFEEAFQITIQRYKQLDIVINSAGIVEEIEWEKAIDVDLTAAMTGTCLAMQQHLPKYKAGEEGIVVNIASVLGLHKSQAFPAYCAAKSGLIAFGRCVGGEEYYKRFKVKVITICPGAVDTPLINNNYKRTQFSKEFVLGELGALNILQTADEVAGSIISIIDCARNGSVWIVEDDLAPIEVELPDYRSLKKAK